MAGGFLAFDEQRAVDLAMNECWLAFIDFEVCAAAAAFGDDDLCHIVERINAGDLLDFLADEADRFLIGDDQDLHAGGGGDARLLARVIALEAGFATIIAATFEIASLAMAVALMWWAILMPAFFFLRLFPWLRGIARP